jgi:hypothetical protein
MVSTTTAKPSTAQTAEIFTSQAVNDAIDRKNTSIINYRDINGGREQLR